MRIKILESNSAVPLAKPGTVREVNDVLGRHLVSLKYAEEVNPGERESGRAGERVEEAVTRAPETAAARPRRKRGATAPLIH